MAGSGEREDPLIAPAFQLDIGDRIQGFFEACSGIGSESEVITHEVTNDKGQQVMLKIPGRIKFEDVVLKRGVTSDMAIWDWRKEIEDGKIEQARANCSVTMLNSEMERVAQWDFVNAWPVKVSGPNLTAGSNEIAVEELRIAHEGMNRVKA